MSATVGESLERKSSVRAPHAETLAASVVILLSMTVAQRVIGFLRGVLFCRWLSLEELGQWDMAFAYLNLAAPLVVLGLPGSFGRYVEHFRQRGEFHAFLRRTAIVTGAASLIALTAMIGWRSWFSELVFGTRGETALTVWLAACLVAVILHNFLTALFIAVRMYRVVTALQFAQGLGFAAISLTLLGVHPQGATSAVIGYTLATLLAAAVSLGWLSRLVRSEPERPASEGQRAFWLRLLPFAVWMWVTNLISNVFDLVDRYMILHHSGMSADEALRQVGNYHSSRIIPLLFVGVAALFASMITPHLTTDWEVGRRESVVRRLNLALKLLAITLLLASTAVLFVAPPLFEFALRNKFQGGLHVLPCTLAYCAWFGLFAVAQNYLWCAERAALSNLPLLVGLILNVLLNLLWLPTYGLPGAVWATTVANLVAMLLTYEFSRRHGMQIDAGTWLASLAIGGLCLGAWTALAACGAVAALSVTTDHVLNADEKQQLREAIQTGLARVRSIGSRMLAAATSH